MPDISMCNGGVCPKKMECYRHRAIPTEGRQSFFYPENIKEGKDSCGYFMEIWPWTKLNPLEDRDERDHHG